MNIFIRTKKLITRAEEMGFHMLEKEVVIVLKVDGNFPTLFIQNGRVEKRGEHHFSKKEGEELFEALLTKMPANQASLLKLL